MISNRTSELAEQIENGETIGFSFQYHNIFTIQFVNSLITKVLSKNNIIFLQTTLITILREMIVNAIKANSKRLYFDIENLDINDNDDYNRGMNNFKAFIIDQKDRVERELKKTRYKVWIYIKKLDNGLQIVIKNNIPMHTFEEKRVTLRIERAKKYSDFSEVYGEMMDDSEGEGLGLILTILFLRNSGIGEDSFKIYSDDENTRSVLNVPFRLKPVEITNEIQEKILQEVNELPSFPEHIIKLQNMCKDPEITIKELADNIKFDPSLTASVLRLSNSAGFITRNRIENVYEAITIIGLKNLNSILVALSSRKIMDDRYSMFKQIWKHCNNVAFYARNIALELRLPKLSESVYLGGLLHDLGKIVLLSTNTKLSEWISDITLNKQMRTSTVLEEVAIGLSHSTIGKIIAEKWKLPEYLVEVIAEHHSPLNAQDEYKDIVEITYLANEMCNIEEKKSDYNYIEMNILEKYNLSDEEKFKALHEDLIKRYSDQTELLQS